MSCCTFIKIENVKLTGKRFIMCSERRTLIWTLVLLLLSGALCNKWNVKYQPVICAARGSSVVFPCSFDYPDRLIVQNIMWGHERNNLYTGPFLFDYNSLKSSSKFEYVGDKQHNCSFKIHSVEHNDQGKYVFRFTTEREEGTWTGSKGSQLKIIDLKIKRSNGHRSTIEGDSVDLTCINSCSGHDPTSAFLWFKNGELIKEAPSLHLPNVSLSSSGNYSCSLKLHKGTTSGVININVEYAPKNTTTSIGPTLEVDPRSSIVVSCSSDANPPVENYTWFRMKEDKDDQSIGNNPELSIMGFSHVDNGQYFCKATNRHGSQKSSVLTLKVKEYFSYSLIIIIIITLATAFTALLIALAVVTAFRKLNKQGTSAPKDECVEDVQDAVYNNWPVFDDSQSQQGNKCQAKTTEEPLYTSVVFTRKSDMQQQTGTCNEDESVIYSTVWK